MYNPTKEEIEALKSQHGELFKLQFDDKCAILKTPDRKTLSAAMSIADKNPVGFNEMLLKNCWVAGDEEIKTNNSYFLGAAQKLADLINIKQADLEKL